MPSSRPIFLSYRRRDALAVDALARELQHRFGEDSVCQDVVAIPPGGDLRAVINELIVASDVVVVAVGSQWTVHAGEEMRANPDDWVRMEIEIAHQLGKPIIPVRLADSAWPARAQLPETIADFADINAARLRSDADMAADIARIVARVAEFVRPDRLRQLREAGWLLAVSATLLAAGALAGSRWLFPDYAPQQLPNVATGIGLALLPWLGVLIDSLVRSSRSRWRLPVPTYRRPWTYVLLVPALAALGYHLSVPQRSLIDAIYAGLESTRAEVPRVRELVRTASALPRYGGSIHLGFAEQVARVRADPDMSDDEVEATLNYFQRFVQDQDPRLRTWSLLTQAEAYRFAEKPDLQIALYEELVHDPDSTNWQQWYGYAELGSIHYVAKDDAATASTYWELAVDRIPTRGMLQNLAVLAEGAGHWDKAEGFYERAEDVLAAYKRERQLVSLGYQEAVLYANWCNKLRIQFESLGRDERSDDLLSSAEQKCRVAIAAYRAYIDARWNLARVQFAGGRYAEARITLREAIRDIREIRATAPESLSRHGYPEYAEAYSAWLLVVSLFREGLAPADHVDARELFTSLVVGAHPSPRAALVYLLERVKAHELTVHDDLDDLAAMDQSGYLAQLGASAPRGTLHSEEEHDVREAEPDAVHGLVPRRRG